MPKDLDNPTLELIETHLHRLSEDKLVIILDFIQFIAEVKTNDEVHEAMLLAEPLLAQDWLTPEEDEAWAHL